MLPFEVHQLMIKAFYACWVITLLAGISEQRSLKVGCLPGLPLASLLVIDPTACLIFILLPIYIPFLILSLSLYSNYLTNQPTMSPHRYTKR